MQEILQYLVIFALQSAAIYAIAASGLVVTYTTSGVFNFAHGAIGMVVAFAYWQMTAESQWGLPVPLALVLCLLVVAPAIGLLLDWALMRRLAGASTIATIVATIGLLFALVQGAGIVWPQDDSRRIPEFFAGESFSLFDVNVTYHRALALAVAVAVAFGLRALLFGTRLGTAMRAVVDSRELTALNGAEPDRVSSVAWMLGCSLAGLAGILIAPSLSQFTAIALTLLVVQAYAAAMVGRLRSLPLTFLGALILAEVEQLLALAEVRGWAGGFSDSLGTLSSAVPVLMLLVVLIVLRDDRSALRSESLGFRVPRPSLRTVATWMGGLVVACLAIGQLELFTVTTRLNLGKGLALGIVMLSLVLLTGWAGQVSLAQLGLSGLAAVAIWKVGPVGGLILGVVVCAAVGALVALPALRMRSLYLALTTMAFALLMETVVYGNDTVIAAFAPFATDRADARRLPGLGSDTAFFVALAVAFALVALGLTLIRNGPFGRRLAAMKDSPAACATLGLDLTATKLQVFALASAIAGLGGGLLAMWSSSNVGRSDYALLEGGALGGLPLVLVAVIGGVTSVAGALFGAVLFVGMPLLGAKVSWLKHVMNLAPGLAGIGLARTPEGAVRQAADGTAEVVEALARVRDGRRRATDEAVDGSADGSGPARPRGPEAMVAAGPVTAADAAHLDHVLGLSWGRR
ncbi:MAG TPA: ABC transporter permease [Acidimicrobiales bacterium]|nr:ABC transporter permease [Acidimicrobiales bacterium]